MPRPAAPIPATPKPTLCTDDCKPISRSEIAVTVNRMTYKMGDESRKFALDYIKSIVLRHPVARWSAKVATEMAKELAEELEQDWRAYSTAGFTDDEAFSKAVRRL